MGNGNILIEKMSFYYLLEAYMYYRWNEAFSLLSSVLTIRYDLKLKKIKRFNDQSMQYPYSNRYTIFTNLLKHFPNNRNW